MTGGVLVVGYGNPLRSDDGVGWHAAALLADDRRFAGMAVLQLHQLTPELALDISESSLVVLIDADRALPPGTVSISTLEQGAVVTDRAWSHHVGPADLVAMALELYGSAGEVFVVGCGVQSLEIGDELTPLVEQALAHIADHVAELVGTWSPPPVPVPEEGRSL